MLLVMVMVGVVPVGVVGVISRCRAGDDVREDGCLWRGGGRGWSLGRSHTLHESLCQLSKHLQLIATSGR